MLGYIDDINKIIDMKLIEVYSHIYILFDSENQRWTINL